MFYFYFEPSQQPLVDIVGMITHIHCIYVLPYVIIYEKYLRYPNRLDAKDPSKSLFQYLMENGSNGTFWKKEPNMRRYTWITRLIAYIVYVYSATNDNNE